MNGHALTVDASTLTTRPVPAVAHRRVREAVVVFGAWALVALVSSGFSALNRVYTNLPPEWARSIALNLMSFEVYCLPTFVFLWTVRRWPLGAGRWRNALLYLVAIPLMVVVIHAIYIPIRVFWFHSAFAEIKTRMIDSFYYVTFMMAMLVGIVHAVEYRRSLRAGQLRASQLESHLAKARLEILRNELQPHFLFNALHSISTLMHRNVEAADEMLTQLADLLRLSLERKNVQEAPLREELAVLAPYLNILRIRFGDRLSIGVDVDPALLDATVPLFLLQPLVENAIRHGIERRAGAGRIEIRARPSGDSIEIGVADDGPGLAPNGFREGIGLSNIRLRLEQIYGDRASISLHGSPESGTEVSVRVPRC
jgi:two-component sensor histidine kinase